MLTVPQKNWNKKIDREYELFLKTKNNTKNMYISKLNNNGGNNMKKEDKIAAANEVLKKLDDLKILEADKTKVLSCAYSLVYNLKKKQ